MSGRLDLVLVTCAVLPEPDPDAAPLAAALEQAGIDFAVSAWDDPGVDWGSARLTLFRSAWNYPQDRVAFLTWAQAAAGCTELWNPLRVAEWNSYKGYLLDLERAGVPIAPTEFVGRGAAETVAAICRRRGWEQVVVKPAVGAASFRARRFPGPSSEAEAHLAALAADGDVLVQQYLASVEDHGERAVVWIDGAITHAVRKTPRFEGDVEVVSAEAVAVEGAEALVVEAAMAAVGSPIMYGRVDVAPGPDGGPVVMELELIEPSLYFTQSRPALQRFVVAIEARLA